MVPNNVAFFSCCQLSDLIPYFCIFVCFVSCCTVSCIFLSLKFATLRDVFSSSFLLLLFKFHSQKHQNFAYQKGGMTSSAFLVHNTCTKQGTLLPDSHVYKKPNKYYVYISVYRLFLIISCL